MGKRKKSKTRRYPTKGFAAYCLNPALRPTLELVETMMYGFHRSTPEQVRENQLYQEMQNAKKQQMNNKHQSIATNI
jgi:hypothetical protein